MGTETCEIISRLKNRGCWISVAVAANFRFSMMCRM